MKQKLAFVMPAYNEAKTIGPTLNDIKKNFPKAKIFVVNDGSKDRTKQIALKSGANVLTHVVNRGLGASLYTGIKAALRVNPEIIITFDADLQHTGSDVKRLIEPIKRNKADAVIGSRFLRKSDYEDMPFVKVLGNKILTSMNNFFSNTNISDSQSGLRALRKKAAEKILIICDRYEVSSEIIHELSGKKFRIKEIPIKAIYLERQKGTNIKSGLEVLLGLALKKSGLKK